MRPRKNQFGILRWGGSWLMLPAGLAVIFMVIIAALPAPVQAASKITQILVSDTTDANGVVSKSKDIFAPTTASIKGTALISGMKKGQKVTADLIYGPKNLKALSASYDIPGTGEVTLKFAFSKPTNNWPIGNYKVLITTSDGVSKSVPFQVK